MAGLQVLRTLVLLDDTQEFFGNQLEAVSPRRPAAIDHSLLAGVEVGRYHDVFTLDVAFLPPSPSTTRSRPRRARR